MTLTAEFLQRRGIMTSPEELEELLREAIESLPAVTFVADPRRDLPPADSEALQRGGFDVRPAAKGEDDPLARTLATYGALLATSLSVGEAADRLGVNPSRIRQRLGQERTLYGIRTRSGWRVPTFQFAEERLIPGVEAVIAALPDDLHPVSVLTWFTQPHTDLEPPPGSAAEAAGPLSPRLWLLLGHDPARVVELARDL